jgi:chromosome segregation ATPase
MRWNLAGVVLLCVSPALADTPPDPPADPCKQVAELEQSITDLAEQIAFLVEDAKPICAQKELAKECARRQVEIAGMMRAIKELQAERKQAKAACAATKP